MALVWGICPSNGSYMWGIWTAFRTRGRGIWLLKIKKFKCPRVCPGRCSCYELIGALEGHPTSPFSPSFFSFNFKCVVRKGKYVLQWQKCPTFWPVRQPFIRLMTHGGVQLCVKAHPNSKTSSNIVLKNNVGRCFTGWPNESNTVKHVL